MRARALAWSALGLLALAAAALIFWPEPEPPNGKDPSSVADPSAAEPPQAARRKGLVVWVAKRARRLYVCRDGQVERQCRAGLGSDPVSDKQREGDGATPQGEFYVCAKNPRSKFGLALVLSYPNAEDAARGLAAGLINREQHDAIVEAVSAGRMPPQDTKLGSWIEIHGRGSASDWTAGCVALDDGDMRELFDKCPVGTPVIITE